MALIFYRDGELSGPRLQCDCCKKIITKEGDALFVWDVKGDDFQKPTHEFSVSILCDPCERANRHLLKWPATMEVPTALVCLVVSLGMGKKEWESAVEHHALLHSLNP